MSTKIILSFMLLMALIVNGQNFHKVITDDVILFEETINQTKANSYIYLGNNSNSYEVIKNNIYSHFDSQINLDIDDYRPDIDATTTHYFYIYKNTSTLNASFSISSNNLVNNDIVIPNQNGNLIAIVSYSMASNLKTISFYNNKELVKIFNDNIEKSISATDIRLMGDLDKFLSHTIN